MVESLAFIMHLPLIVNHEAENTRAHKHAAQIKPRGKYDYGVKGYAAIQATSTTFRLICNFCLIWLQTATLPVSRITWDFMRVPCAT
jgi:isoprenylcysteine carboxyl methyltransferase (ICMT) family protein YpbQ